MNREDQQVFSDAEDELLDALILLKRLNKEFPDPKRYEKISALTKQMLKYVRTWRNIATQQRNDA